MQKIILNFLISPQNKQRFEAVCDSNGVTMSSVLNNLIESYVIDQAEIIEDRAVQFQRLDAAITATNKHRDHRHGQVKSDDADDYPLSILFDDGGEWDNHHDF